MLWYIVVPFLAETKLLTGGRLDCNFCDVCDVLYRNDQGILQQTCLHRPGGERIPSVREPTGVLSFVGE